MICVAATLALVTVRVLSRSASWIPAFVTAAFLLFSIPVFDALTWQATLLDKTALLISSARICCAATIDLSCAGHLRVIGINIAFFVLVALAYNAKEAVFFLGPSLFLLVGCRLVGTGQSWVAAMRRSLVLTALPLIYACFHVGIVLVNRLVISPDEFKRVTGGNMLFNLEFYTRYMFNMLDGFNLTQIGILCCIGALASVWAIRFSLRKPEDGPPALPLWAAVSFFGSFALPLRTSATPPFYLLVPMLYLSILVGLTVDTICTRMRPWAARSACIAAALAFVALHIATLRSAFPSFTRLAEESRNFERALRVVRQEIVREQPRSVVFIYPAGESTVYMFLSAAGGVGPHALSPYLLPLNTPKKELDAFDKTIVDAPDGPLAPAAEPGELRVILGGSARLDRVERTRDDPFDAP